MKPIRMSELNGKAIRLYRSDTGVVYCALCDVAAATGYPTTTALAECVKSCADAHFSRPEGDQHRKWVARWRDVSLFLGTGSVTHEETQKAFKDERVELVLEKQQKMQASLQARLDKHDLDIQKLEARLLAQRKGRTFIQELLDELS